MSDKTKTRYHNIDVLLRLGFKQISNTVVFKSKNNYILSPSVSKNKNGKYWFDIREINLNKVTLNSFLLIRIVPDLFIHVKIESLSYLLSKRLMDNRPHSGNVWGIHLEINEMKSSGYLFNVKDRDHKLRVSLLNKNKLDSLFTSH